MLVSALHQADLDLAWAAGLFEGEGCISTDRDKATGRTYPTMTVKMTDSPIVERFAQVMGTGKVHFGSPRKKGWKPFYTWKVTGIDAVMGMVTRLAPFLGERRLAQWDKAFASYIETHPEVTRKCRLCGNPFYVRVLSGACADQYCSVQHRERARWLRRRAAA